MTTQQQYIERLKGMVAHEFGRSIATVDDCAALSKAVEEATDMRLEADDYATLFFPKTNMAPRPIILSALTRYVGYESWSSFCASSDVLPAADSDVIPAPRRWGVFILTVAAILVVVITAVVLLNDSNENVKTYSTQEISAVVEGVEERWLARALEECNALRAYIDDADYSERIDNILMEYSTTLYEEIVSELDVKFKEHNITLSQDEIIPYAEDIMVQCYTMCETLYFEEEIVE